MSLGSLSLSVTLSVSVSVFVCLHLRGDGGEFGHSLAEPRLLKSKLLVGRVVLKSECLLILVQELEDLSDVGKLALKFDRLLLPGFHHQNSRKLRHLETPSHALILFLYEIT